MPGEFDFISWLRAQPPADPTGRVRVGVGDDLAVVELPPGDLLLVGIDQVLDGVHFDSAVHGPRAIGRKAVNRNLSDCAAMACLPAAAVVSLALPRGVGDDYAKQLYLGARDAGDAQGCPIVGGDTGSWPGKLAVTVAIVGRSAGTRPVTRAGAKVGDVVYVTGPLGGSLLGRHMTFQPRVAMGRSAAAAGATAMIDLSDGLSRDVAHLCRASSVGVMIDADAVPVHDDARAMAADDGRSPLDHALHDGEDYELLFTCPPGAADVPGRAVGRVVAEPQVFITTGGGRRELLVPRSWEHVL